MRSAGEAAKRSCCSWWLFNIELEQWKGRGGSSSLLPLPVHHLGPQEEDAGGHNWVTAKAQGWFYATALGTTDSSNSEPAKNWVVNILSHHWIFNQIKKAGFFPYRKNLIWNNSDLPLVVHSFIYFFCFGGLCWPNGGLQVYGASKDDVDDQKRLKPIKSARIY